MKHLLLTTIDRALIKAAHKGNIEVVKQHLTAGTDVNAKDDNGLLRSLS